MDFSILGNMDAFLLGMRSEATRNNTKENNLNKVLKETANLLDSKMRDVYDNLVPNVHVLDIDYTVSLLLRDLTKNPENYFSKILVEEDGQIYEQSIDSTNKSQAVNAAKSLLTPSTKQLIRSKIIAAVQEFHAKLPGAGLNPIDDLNTRMSAPFARTQQILDNPDIPYEAKVAATYKLGMVFKQQIDLIFGKHAIMQVSVPSLGSKSARVAFFSKVFSRLSNRINPIINNAMKNALQASLNVGMKFVVGNGISVGSIVHFAHTALKSGNTSIINSPAYAKLMYLSVNAPANAKSSPYSAPLRSSEYFKKKTGHIRVGLVVDKSAGGIISSTSVLMQLGLTFTTDHSATLNLLMAGKEKQAAFTGANYSEVLIQRRALEIVSKLTGGNLLEAKASPSLGNLLVTHFEDILKYGKSKAKKYTTKKNASLAVTYSEVTKTKPKITPQKLAGKSSTRNLPVEESGRKLQTPQLSLTSLQNLLNYHLQDVISANMGDGNSKNILNYRTGRFAASAKVEKLSQSKEGMITAFYSYMRNPYGTFSAGGRQQHPRSRDPKLLISKSIHEIAATATAARMRAVLV